MKSWQVVMTILAVSLGLTLAEIPSETWATPATMSLVCGVSALALMAAAAVLAARWPFIESLFGGLDRVYEAHKWLGVSAMSHASVHLLFKAGIPSSQTSANHA